MAGGALLIIAAALATALMIKAAMPVLRRYALARPNARSSHTVPTPQGGGMAIVLTIVALLIGIAIFGSHEASPGWAIMLAVVLILLAVIGAVDDIHALPVTVRLVVQFVAAALVVSAIPDEFRILVFLPGWLEVFGLTVGMVWFINLTNFMDGIDGITVVEMISISAGIVLIHNLAGTPATTFTSVVAIGLIGALLGFAPFNRHVAHVFMGDVGSLPVGALVGWMLIVIAGEGFIAAALLLPMYYLFDATITLYRRWRRGEKLHEAHRSHFYQLAVQHGFRVPDVTNCIFGLNVALILLALLTVQFRSVTVDLACLIAGAILTAALLRHFERGRYV